MSKWTEQDIPDQTGRVAVVTGANSGIGFDAARALAQHGAQVVLACRDTKRGEDAAQRIRASHAGAQVEVMSLDLSSLASVRAFASALAEKHPAVHLLVNNAGVMALPLRRTQDGFEMQLGTNHLGHFALTGLVLPLLEKAGAGARVVNVSSMAHRLGRMDFETFRGREEGYSNWGAYGQSKLANLLFTYELQRRLAAAGSAVVSVACHPGYSATNLHVAGPQMEGKKLAGRVLDLGAKLFAQPAHLGALPTLHAAVAPGLKGGEFIGPDGLSQMRGHPRVVQPSAAARDEAVARRLWEESESLTGVRFLSAAGTTAAA